MNVMEEWTPVCNTRIQNRIIDVSLGPAVLSSDNTDGRVGVFVISEGPGKTGQKRVPKHLFVARLGMQIESPGEVGPRYNM